MIKITNIQTCNWRAAIRGCRNPLESWAKSDSYFDDIYYGGYTNLAEEPMDGVPDHIQEVYIGPNDLDLMKRLANAGTDHSKFMRMITVSFDIVAPLYFWKEFDTYKIGVVRNSCSTMHKIEARKLTIDDFATDNMTNADLAIMETVILHINNLITLYKTSINNREKLEIHRRIVKLLPDSYMQRATITTNYQVLRNIRNSDRKTHKLLEWREDFMKFIDSLPYAKELLIKEEKIIDNHNKCNREKCEGCESFMCTSSVLDPYKLHIKCEKRKQVSIVDLPHTVKPEDFNEEEVK